MDTLVTGSAHAPGFLGIWPPHQRPELRRSQDDPHLKCWNGAKIRLRAAQKADRFRGANNDGAVLDEIDSWKPEAVTPSEAFAIADMSVRTGPDPRIFASSTPKRGRLVAELRKRDDCLVTLGSMAENLENLHPAFVDAMERRYGGTRLGRQELMGELLEEIEGALVHQAMIDAGREPAPPVLERVAVGVDPSGSIGGDRQGIVAVGATADHGYVLGDRSCSMRPEGWGRRVIETVLEFDADSVVLERNYGGDMARSVIEQAARQAGVTVRIVEVSASRAKHVRFEPVAALYEQGRLHHVGVFADLEDSVTAFTADGYDGDGSPDAADALVWSVTHLLLDRSGLGVEAALRAMEGAA